MKNLFTILSVVALSLSCVNSYAQNMKSSDRKKFDAALQFAEESNNKKAIDLLQALYKSYPEDINVTYNLGLCYMNMSGNPDSALYYLNKTLKLDNDKDWTPEKTELHVAMARVKQLKYDYDGALKLYKKIEAKDPDTEFKELIAREKSICETAKIMMNNPVRLQVRRLGDNINCNENDYRPVISSDMQTLIFTSRRKNNVRTDFEDGQNEERSYISTRSSIDEDWGEAEVIDGLFDRKGQETVTCLRDSNLYIVRDGNIYVSHLDTAGVWQPAQELSSVVNSRSEERFAYVTPDGNELYFSSNREGGFGGFDIYRSFRLPNGQWGVPRNLGNTINTEFDEDAPVMHPTKNILYFASNGHNTMGGFDIFYSLASAADSSFEAVQNIGYPINTPDDDLYFVPAAKRDVAYYASIKWDNVGDEFTGYDIYEVEYDEPEINKLAILSGYVQSNNISDVNITALCDGEAIGRFVPNSQTGKFVIVVEEGKSYKIVADNGKMIKNIDVATNVGDSYYRLGHTISVDSISFLNEELAALTAQYANKDSEDDNKYTVQILSLRTPLDYARLCKNLDKDSIIEYQYTNGWYVYSYGKYTSYREAKTSKGSIVESTPYSDAFVRRIANYKKFVKKIK